VITLRRALCSFILALVVGAPAWAQTRTVTLVNAVTLAAAGTYTGDVARLPAGVGMLAVQSVFVRAAGGTSTKVYIQTSLDGGVTWIDVAQHAFLITTATKVSAVRAAIAMAGGYVPTDGTLADDTIKDGLMGDRVRVKWVVAGTYTGASSITVTAVAN
jgi:hypothetical protein